MAFIKDPTQHLDPWVPSPSHEHGQKSRLFPSLVAFVGQTGAGKSSIIKLLIELTSTPSHGFPTPVVGAPGSDTPTSADVHLYLDPSTVDSSSPLLFADCEGLNGGEREPLAARFKRSASRTKRAHISTFREQRYTARQRELLWVNEADTRSREFAVTNLYPRLLYTFSDVIVFVLKEHRTVEKVLEKLVSWAAAALETSSNQPVLPHAIIVLNETNPAEVDANAWNMEHSTESLLRQFASNIHSNKIFSTYAKFWRDRNRDIDSAQDLLLSYYESIRIVRTPSAHDPDRMALQIDTLAKTIKAACKSSREDKEKLRMLVDADQLDPYLQYAFDQYAASLDKPFDFIQASYRDSPIPHDFAGRILKLVINMMSLRPHATAPQLFTDLSSMVASCMMLETVRSEIPGTAEAIFPMYLEHMQLALETFANLHWPCEYVKPGTNSRCVNVGSGHISKDHQFANGRIHVGEYVSSFGFDAYDRVFQSDVFNKFRTLLQALREQVPPGDAEERIASRIHEERTLTKFFARASSNQPSRLLNHTVCYACLFELPEHVLSCGHVICTPCARSYGKLDSEIIVVRHCPMDGKAIFPPCEIVLKPDDAGVRLLTLDGGGVRGIVILALLQRIEDELENKLPIELLFDMIVGTSTGGLIALGLGVEGWDVQRCREQFLSLCSQAFTRRPGSTLRGFGRVVDFRHNSRYKTQPYEAALVDAFTKERSLFGGVITRGQWQRRTTTKVAVVATKTPGTSVVLANYNRQCAESLQYHFVRPEKPEDELRVWQVARATSAAPGTFKSIRHQATQQEYIDGGLYHNNPVKIAWKELQLAWPSVGIIKPDIVVSIGTSAGPVTPPETPSLVPRYSRGNLLSNIKSGYRIVQNHFENTLDSEKIWNSFISLRPEDERKRLYRLNPALNREPPKLDDVAGIQSLEMEIDGLIQDEPRVRAIALHLLASLFYFEVIETLNNNDLQTLKGTS